MAKTVLVVGATGATGKFVVLQLLQQKHRVRAIVRSKERLLNNFDDVVEGSSRDLHIVGRLDVTEASLLDMSQSELEEIVKGCDAVVSCLGHNLTLKGLFLPPRRLVRAAATRLCQAIEATNETSDAPTKFILMGSDGVANPSGGDDKRRRSERIVLSILRHTIAPHKDNELAAAYISGVSSPKIEWAVVRPTDLINGNPTKYELFAKPQKGLFASAKHGVATRSNVTKCMVDMILSEELWDTWKFKMPVVHDDLEGNVICN
jgi:NAD(P)-dependent dehydrogenase (short-subunit alcohol dehydrogenase family)